MTKLNGHTESELRLAIRQERQALIRERLELLVQVRRLAVVDDRLAELERAELLLENGLH